MPLQTVLRTTAVDPDASDGHIAPQATGGPDTDDPMFHVDPSSTPQRPEEGSSWQR